MKPKPQKSKQQLNKSPYTDKEIVDIIAIYDNQISITLKDQKENKHYDIKFLIDSPCCSNKYFTIDDDLNDYKNSIYLGYNLSDVKQISETNEELYESFLDIYTSNGVLSVSCHNKHNGYYAGIELSVIYNNH